MSEGFAAGEEAWGGADALRVWTLEAWRDGASRGRGALLLALRAAVVAADGTPGGAYARDALWALLRETWNEEGGAGTVNAGNADAAEVADADSDSDADPASDPTTTRAVAKGSSAILPSLSRAAANAVARARGVSHDVLARLFVLAATSDDGAGDGGGTFARILAGAVESARDPVAFLAARAASDPAAVAPEVPRVALALLSSRAATRDAAKAEATTTSGWLLSVLVVACAAADPGVRAAGARAVAALAPARRDGKKGVAPAWRALAAAAEDIAGDGTGADARAALADALADGFRGDADGSALRETLATLARLDDDGGESSSSSAAVRAGAYGCRRLVAALDGIGDDVVKATACAPALRWALRGGDGSDPEETTALAVALVEGYAPAAAAQADADADDAWRAYVSAFDAAAPAPARVAAACRATPEFFDALPERARGDILRALFAATGGDPDAGVRAAARDATDALRLRADDIRRVLDAAAAHAKGAVAGAVSGAEKGTPAAKRARGRRRDAVASESPARDEGAVAAAVAALEVLAWKSEADVDARETLAEPCQALLAALLDAAKATRERRAEDGKEAKDERKYDEEDENDDDDVNDDADASRLGVDEGAGEASGGYAQALVLSTLEMLASASSAEPIAPATPSKSKTKAKSKAKAKASSSVSESSWDVPLVVRAVQEAEAGPAREAALALLAAVAATDPRGVMTHVLDVGAVLAHRASEASDDPLAQRALERALSAVVPAWIAGGYSVAEAAAKVVDALPDAPQHRRAPLCAALLRACPEGEGLPRVLTLLLGRARALEEAAAAAATRRAKRAAKRAEEIGGLVAAAMAEEAVTAHAVEASSAWVMDLAATLLAKETATASVDALVAVMRVRDDARSCFLLTRPKVFGWFFLSTSRPSRLHSTSLVFSRFFSSHGPARVSLMI